MISPIGIFVPLGFPNMLLMQSIWVQIRTDEVGENIACIYFTKSSTRSSGYSSSSISSRRVQDLYPFFIPSAVLVSSDIVVCKSLALKCFEVKHSYSEFSILTKIPCFQQYGSTVCKQCRNGEQNMCSIFLDFQVIEQSQQLAVFPQRSMS